MKSYYRTDLVAESYEKEGKALEGVDYRTVEHEAFRIHRMEIYTEEAARRLGKPLGEYVTLECGNVQYLTMEESDCFAQLLAGDLHRLTQLLIGKQQDTDLRVLAVGLGTAELTVDSIGPRAVSRLTATRHLREHEPELYRALECSSLATLIPGVMGQTGIEALELLRAAVESVRPDLIIVIDALAAGSCDRLATTVQLSSVGIFPGSGVGNHRSAITAETVGVPVISMGIPTVVDSATLICDALKLAHMDESDEGLKKVLENGRSFFVSPKESDVIVSHFSKLLSKAIDLAYVGELPF